MPVEDVGKLPWKMSLCRIHSATYGHLCVWCLARGFSGSLPSCQGSDTLGLGWGSSPEPSASRPGPLQTELPPPRGPRGSYLVKLLLYFLFALVSRSSILETARARVDVRAAVRMDKTVHPHRDFQTRTRLPDPEIRSAPETVSPLGFNPIAGPGSGSGWI